jgi:predicted nucleotidyltransferase
VAQSSSKQQVSRDEVLAALRANEAALRPFHVASLRLFGSVARDEATPASDIDLLVTFDQTPSFSQFMRLRILLEDLLGAPVDLVTESGLRDRIRPAVEREAIRVA